MDARFGSWEEFLFVESIDHEDLIISVVTQIMITVGIIIQIHVMMDSS